MNESIKSVIREWETAQSPFSFETRIHPVLTPSNITSDTPFINMAFIIDVKGFFVDKEHKQAIALHHERVISIDRYNQDTQYTEDLRKDLKLFTAAAHEMFFKILSTSPQPTYTSDPKFMK